MIRIGRILVAGALAALLAGCNDAPAVFEDVGDDPHPPSLTVLGIGLQLPAGEADTPPPVTYYPPDTVLTVRPFDPAANLLSLQVSYSDAGGDITAVVVRDQDGPIAGNLQLPEFLGTAGTFAATVDVPTTAVAGTHTLEVWAEDSNGSRSAKTTVAVNVELF